MLRITVTAEQRGSQNAVGISDLTTALRDQPGDQLSISFFGLFGIPVIHPLSSSCLAEAVRWLVVLILRVEVTSLLTC